MTSPKYSTDDELDNLIPLVSNWNKWGPDDQLGTINYILPSRIKEVAKLIETGKIISLARESSVSEHEVIDNLKFQEYNMIKNVNNRYCADFIGFIFHGYRLTHLDGLCHVFANDHQMYNGYSRDEIRSNGSRKLGVEHFGDKGIVGRGILIDIANLKGRALEPGEIIYLQDIQEAIKLQGVELQSGDILFVRSGTGIKNTSAKMSGLHPECIPWLYQYEFSLLGNDGASDYYPNNLSRYHLPIHEIVIPYMGLPLIDNADLDVLSQTCIDEDRWEFMITIAPWRMKGVTGSPVNPLAFF